MTYKELTNPRLKSRPKFYENHKNIINATLLEPNTMSMYLHENMLQFYQDIDDVANCMDTYSCLDGHYASLEYQYGNQQYLTEI